MDYAKNAYVSNNQSYVSATALQIRLDTAELLQRIRQFLTGETEIISEQDGKIIRTTLPIGDKKANDNGIQSIVNRINLILNPSYVQGNFDVEQYGREVAQIRRSLRDALMINLHNWDIKEEDYEDIIDGIMTMLKGFISRLINNKERESYETTLRHVESNTQTYDKRDKGGL